MPVVNPGGAFKYWLGGSPLADVKKTDPSGVMKYWSAGDPYAIYFPVIAGQTISPDFINSTATVYSPVVAGPITVPYISPSTSVYSPTLTVQDFNPPRLPRQHRRIPALKKSKSRVIAPWITGNKFTPLVDVGSFPEPDGPAFVQATARFEVYLSGALFNIYALNGSIDFTFTLSGRSSGKMTLFSDEGLSNIIPGAPVAFYYGATKLFGGQVEDVKVKHELGTIAPALLYYDCLLTDYGSIAEHRVIPYYIISAGTTLYQAVTYINDNFLDGEGFFVSTTVAAVSFASELKLEMVTVAEAFRRMAEVCQVDWFADQYRYLQFGTFLTVPAPFTIRDDDGNWDSLEVGIKRGSYYRNTQVVATSLSVMPNRTETFTGDGTTMQFDLFFPAKQIISVTVGTAVETVGELTEAATWSWGYTPNTRRLYRNPALPPVSSAVTISVVYRSEVTNAVVSKDATEITTRAAFEGGSGKYERVSGVSDIRSSDTLDAIADGRRSRFGNGLPKEATLLTRRLGLLPGQVLDINVLYPPLDAELLITQVQLRVEDKEIFRTTVTCGANEDNTPRRDPGSSADPLIGSGYSSGGMGGGGNVYQTTSNGRIRECRFFLALTLPGETNPGLVTGVHLGNAWTVREQGNTLDVSIYFQTPPVGQSIICRICVDRARADLAFTASPTSDQLWRTDHGLVDGDTVTLSTDGTLPGGLSTGTTYYVVNAVQDFFQVSLTSGGDAVDITDAGTGNHDYATPRTVLINPFAFPAGAVAPVDYSVLGGLVNEDDVLTIDVLQTGLSTKGADGTVVLRYGT